MSKDKENNEEYEGLVYNMWIDVDGDVTVNVAGNLIMQTGKPELDPPEDPPPGG